MLQMARFEPRAHQDRDEASQESVQKLYVLPRDFLEVPKLPRMQNSGES
jgi:hypothetical protein